MTFWYSIRIKVSGRETQLRTFLQKINGESIVESFLPVPQELLGYGSKQNPSTGCRFWRDQKPLELLGEQEYLIAKFGTDSIEEWKRDNWGSLSHDFNTDISMCDDESIMICANFAFRTAFDAVEKISGLFPDLEFIFSSIDEGYNLCLRGKFVNTELLDWHEEESYYHPYLKDDRGDPKFMRREITIESDQVTEKENLAEMSAEEYGTQLADYHKMGDHFEPPEYEIDFGDEDEEFSELSKTREADEDHSFYFRIN